VARFVSSRLVGLLLAASVVAAGVRWLDPPDPESRPRAAPRTSIDVVPASIETTPQWLDLMAARRGKSPPPREEEEIAGTRPASASLCHALEEKLLALHARALAGLTGQEQRELRVERHRTREHLEALRCREAGGRSWF
jgi:hypothetical protein